MTTRKGSSGAPKEQILFLLIRSGQRWPVARFPRPTLQQRPYKLVLKRLSRFSAAVAAPCGARMRAFMASGQKQFGVVQNAASPNSMPPRAIVLKAPENHRFHQRWRRTQDVYWESLPFLMPALRLQGTPFRRRWFRSGVKVINEHHKGFQGSRAGVLDASELESSSKRCTS